jgi:16S rRNA C967 or C1407 C5-methylase (RsmB/RsmF family)
LAKRQYGLLASALLAAKSGGLIVYSTCALSYEENDGVVERLLARKQGDVEVVFKNAPSPFAEKTSCGWIHLPDRCGFGPLYFSVLKKI